MESLFGSYKRRNSDFYASKNLQTKSSGLFLIDQSLANANYTTSNLLPREQSVISDTLCNIAKMICFGCLIPFVITFLLVQVGKITDIAVQLWFKLRAQSERRAETLRLASEGTNDLNKSKTPEEVLGVVVPSVCEGNDTSSNRPLSQQGLKTKDSDNVLKVGTLGGRASNPSAIELKKVVRETTPHPDLNRMQRFDDDDWVFEDDPIFAEYNVIFYDGVNLFE